MSGEAFLTHGDTSGGSSRHAPMAHIADDLAERAGFLRCTVRVSRTLEMCEVMAVHGDAVDPHGAPFHVGQPVPNADVKKLLASGRGCASLTFVPVEWRGTDGSDLPVHRERWRAGDFLIALVRDDDGRVRGSVLLDEPIDGLRPTHDDLVQLSEELHLPLGGLLSAIENEDLSHQLRMARRMRELIRELDHRTTLAELLDLARDQMRDVFRADDLTLYLDADGDDPAVGALVASGGLHDALAGVMQAAWEEKDVLVAEPEGVRDSPDVDAAQTAELLGMMAEFRIGTLVMVPIGLGPRCFGTLAVTRDLEAPRWTSSETRAAVEVGRDLGRAVLNARRYEREQRMRNDLERLEEHRSQMISTISHELKNPIGVIQGHLELLGESPDRDQATARSLEAIARGAERLATLANDLLVLSRVADLDRPVQVDRVDMAEVVQEAMEFARVMADRAEVTLQPVVVDGDATVLGSRDDLRLVASNLLSNAVKYSDPGDQVSVRMLRRGGYVVLICTDTGIGISPEDQGRLFDEFFRSTNPEATHRPGTGLGLVILKRVVARHGGYVEVESVQGEGTTFRVSLPAAPGVAPGQRDGSGLEPVGRPPAVGERVDEAPVQP